MQQASVTPNCALKRLPQGPDASRSSHVPVGDARTPPPHVGEKIAHDAESGARFHPEMRPTETQAAGGNSYS